MSENDMIAEYVKERYPELLNTTDFALYRISCEWNNFVDSFKKSIKNIDFNKVEKFLKEVEKDEVE